MEELASEMSVCGAILLTEESIQEHSVALLASQVDSQPAWSDLPILIFASNASSETILKGWEKLGERANINLIDRPVKIKTLVSAVNTALRNRRQQYHVRALMEQLEKRLHERDKFLAILGHELRNPLTAIVLAAQTIDYDDKEMVREQIDTITRQSKQLSRLVNDLLDISRVSAGKIRLKKQKLEINREIRSTLDSMAELFRENGLRVSFDSAQEDLWIDGDGVRVEQIVTNLLTNAVKYTRPGGSVIVHTREDEGKACVTIEDDGVGIAPEMIHNIFELFTQVDDTIDRSRGGMGVGLTLVKNLVRLHGGDISVHSDGIDRGSRFELYFPLGTAPDESDAAPQGAAVKPGSRRIVVVEDNPDIRRLLELKLKALGHQVTTAQDGQEGLDVLTRVRPDIGIVDIGLPGLDGYEVARRFRRECPGATRLIALTGYGQPEDRRKAEEAGFDHHLTKPPEFEELQKYLQEA